MDLIKPVVLVDCDGVLANFLDLALNFINSRTEKNYQYSDVIDWDIFESLGHPHLWKEFCSFLNTPEICYNHIKPYEDAIKNFKILSNCKVLIVTAPVDAIPWMHERTQWLRKHFDISLNDIVFAHSKEYVRGDYLIDDKPANVFAWSEMNPDGIGILWDQPYNRKVVLPPRVLRVSKWQELEGILKERKK